MTGRVLLDTNLLVYCYDRSEPHKQQRAIELLGALASAQAGCVSTQVLAEFFTTVTRKLPVTLPPDIALDRLDHHMQIWNILAVPGLVVREAARGTVRHRMNFWDAQIWAAARVNRIPLIFSEDFQHDAVLDDVRLANPFRADFRLENYI